MRIKFAWATGKTLTYVLFDEVGNEITGSTSLPETEVGVSGYYTVLDAAILTNYVVVITETGSGIVGYGVAEASVVVTSAGYVGDFEIGDTLYFVFGTNKTLTVADTLRVYKDDSTDPLGTAQATVTIDGPEPDVHSVAIVLGRTNYDPESDYTVVLSGATIGGDIITAIVGSFSVENRYQEPVARHVHK